MSELTAEANLWLTSRGATCVELMAFPEDQALLADLLAMQFRPDTGTGT